MSNEDIKHFDFYDIRSVVRKYKEGDLDVLTDESGGKDGNT